MDREKVIKGLECCLGSNDCDVEPEEDCPYKGMCLCAMALRFDVLALLKEQKEEIENLKQTCQSMMEGICLLKEQEAVVRCKDCKHYHKGFNCDLLQKPIMKGADWFCADGERK